MLRPEGRSTAPKHSDSRRVHILVVGIPCHHRSRPVDHARRADRVEVVDVDVAQRTLETDHARLAVLARVER